MKDRSIYLNSPRVFQIGVVIVTAFALVYLLLTENLSPAVLFSAGSVVAVAVGVFHYLSSSELSTTPAPSIGLPQGFANLEARISQLEGTLAQISISAEAKASLVATASSLLATAALDDAIQLKLNSYAQQLIRASAMDSLHDNTVTSLARLNTEVADRKRRSNVNLIIGIVITFVGAGVLAVAALGELPTPQPGKSWDIDVLKVWLGVRFAPRLALSIVIEIFAYFFLKLYRANLAEIQYFQNEMTNIEVRRTALTAAITLNDAQSAAAIMTATASVDRNTSAKTEASKSNAKEVLKTAQEALKFAGKVTGTRSD